VDINRKPEKYEKTRKYADKIDIRRQIFRHQKMKNWEKEEKKFD